MESSISRREVVEIDDMSSADMIRTLVHLAVASKEEIEGYEKNALVYETEYGISLVPRVLIRSLPNGNEVYGIGIEAKAWKKFGDQLYWDIRIVKKFLKKERR